MIGEENPMLLKDLVLVALFAEFKKDEPDLDRVYSHFTGPKFEDFIRAMVQLEEEGSVYVPRGAWSPNGDNPLPYDIVMTGVKLTDSGWRKAEQLKRQLGERLK
jgi:hypothetical protein